MPLFRKLTYCLLLSALMAVEASAQRLPAKATQRIMDLADVLTDAEKQHLSDTLATFEQKTSNQLVVLIGKTLNGQKLDSIGPLLADKWQIGQADKDNGILLSIFLDDRTSRIDVGYGLESYLTDAQAKWALDKKMIPEFQKGAFNEGIREVVYYIMSKTDSAYVAEERIESRKKHALWKTQEELTNQAEDEIYAWREKLIYTALSSSFIFLLAYILALVTLQKDYANTVGVQLGEKPAFTDIAKQKEYFQRILKRICILGGIVLIDNVFFNLWDYVVMFGDDPFVVSAMGVTVVGYIAIQIMVRRKLKGKERRRLVLTAFVVHASVLALSFIGIQSMVEITEARWKAEIEHFYYYSISEPTTIFATCASIALFAHLLVLLTLNFKSSGGGYSRSSGSSSSYSSGTTYSNSSRSSASRSSSYSSGSSSSSSYSRSSSYSSGSSSSRSSGSFSGGGGKFGGGGASSSW